MALPILTEGSLSQGALAWMATQNTASTRTPWLCCNAGGDRLFLLSLWRRVSQVETDWSALLVRISEHDGVTLDLGGGT